MKKDFKGKLDSPQSNQQVGGNFMLVNGWIFVPSGKLLTIEIFIDGKFITLAHYGLPRYDIFRIYQSEESYESGFIARIPIDNLTFGLHRLRVFVRDFSGEHFDEVVFFRTKINGPPPYVPPLAAGQIGQFRKLGQKFLDYCIKIANLKSNEKILEVGCGSGRFSLAFSKYLTKEGSYDAIDPISYQIEYCTKHISKRFPNFNFQLIDVYNGEYNRKGKHSASSYKFPFLDSTFDFVFLHSVFTHMLVDDMKNYFKEIARVLKKDGRCLITFLLYNEERLELMKINNIKFRFNHKFDCYRLMDINHPENAIAYDEDFIRELFIKNHLLIEEPIHYTRFIQKKREHQDFIIAHKNNQ